MLELTCVAKAACSDSALPSTQPCQRYRSDCTEAELKTHLAHQHGRLGRASHLSYEDMRLTCGALTTGTALSHAGIRTNSKLPKSTSFYFPLAWALIRSTMIEFRVESRVNTNPMISLANAMSNATMYGVAAGPAGCPSPSKPA